jgi:hypothetical protein
MELKEVLERFKKAHGDKYDYSMITYFDINRSVLIRCKKHDLDFLMKPQNHMKGFGCPYCED